MSPGLSRCDACKQRREVRVITGQTSDGLNIDVSLCRNCWLKWVQDFGVRATVRHKRNTFRVVDEKDIS
jgi:hypothetical protein